MNLTGKTDFRIKVHSNFKPVHPPLARIISMRGITMAILIHLIAAPKINKILNKSKLNSCQITNFCLGRSYLLSFVPPNCQYSSSSRAHCGIFTIERGREFPITITRITRYLAVNSTQAPSYARNIPAKLYNYVIFHLEQISQFTTAGVPLGYGDHQPLTSHLYWKDKLRKYPFFFCPTKEFLPNYVYRSGEQGRI